MKSSLTKENPPGRGLGGLAVSEHHRRNLRLGAYLAGDAHKFTRTHKHHLLILKQTSLRSKFAMQLEAFRFQYTKASKPCQGSAVGEIPSLGVESDPTDGSAAVGPSGGVILGGGRGSVGETAGPGLA